jgi:hypothetical protein
MGAPTKTQPFNSAYSMITSREIADLRLLLIRASTSGSVSAKMALLDALGDRIGELLAQADAMAKIRATCSLDKLWPRFHEIDSVQRTFLIRRVCDAISDFETLVQQKDQYAK